MIEIKRNLINTSEFNRPGTKLLSVEKLVVHYVNNPNTTAQQNVDYIDNLRYQNKDGEDLRYGSAHYFVDGNEIIQIIPEDERAYHVGADKYTDYGLSISSYPNARTLGIEFSHPDESGKPSLKTYSNMIDLLAVLCKQFDLSPMRGICRHYDITGVKADGSICPKFYVDVDTEFFRLKSDVKNRMVNL